MKTEGAYLIWKKLTDGRTYRQTDGRLGIGKDLRTISAGELKIIYVIFRLSDINCLILLVLIQIIRFMTSTQLSMHVREISPRTCIYLATDALITNVRSRVKAGSVVAINYQSGAAPNLFVYRLDSWTKWTICVEDIRTRVFSMNNIVID